MTRPTTVRLEPALKKRLDKISAELDRTPHSLMVEGITEAISLAEARLTFMKEARRRSADFAKNRVGYDLEDFDDWFRRATKGERRPALPRPHKL